MNATPHPTEAEASAHVETIVRGAGTSFFWAMRRLPESKRRAVYGIYAFCREVDDVADGPGTPEEKREQLGRWRDAVERLYAAAPRDPVAVALRRPVGDFGLDKENFLDVIDGMEMDARARVRIADMDELDLYCDRVACAVGRLCVRVFGLEDAVGRELAFALGQALQLTNILRDVAEDAAVNRLYIPGDLLAAHGIAGEELSAVLGHHRFPDACADLAAVAERRFEQAGVAARQCDPAAVRPAVMMMEVYRRILVRLKRRGWRDLDAPVGLSRLSKFWIALRFGFLA